MRIAAIRSGLARLTIPYPMFVGA